MVCRRLGGFDAKIRVKSVVLNDAYEYSVRRDIFPAWFIPFGHGVYYRSSVGAVKERLNCVDVRLFEENTMNVQVSPRKEPKDARCLLKSTYKH